VRIPAYPKYKPSGEAWLPVLPDHWDMCKLRLISRRYAGGTPDKGNEAYWEDGDIPWLNSGAVNDGYITKPSAFITRDGFSNSSAKWIPKGAIVMALAGQGRTKGMVAQLGINTTCNQSMAAIIPSQRIQSRYLYWWLGANYHNIRNMAGGEARDGLNLDLLGDIPCPLPRDEEQRTISEFLDCQTVKIDDLIGKKKRLISLLKEKRAAVISNAVTNGLYPQPMKDAGVEWLLEIPEEWHAILLRRITRDHKQGYYTQNEYVDEGVKLARITDIDDFGNVNFDNMPLVEITPKDERSFAISTGDFLFARSGTIGRFGVVTKTERAVFASYLIRFRFKNCNPEYLKFYFLSKYFKKSLLSSLHGGAN